MLNPPQSFQKANEVIRCDDLKLLHLIWEHPKRVVGGLGVAGASLCEALDKNDGVSVKVMAPRSQMDNREINMNSYHLDIDSDSALELQESVMREGELSGVDGAVAAFTQEIYLAEQDELRRNECSLVHAHDWMTAAAGVIVQRSQGVPLILHVHSTQVDREGVHAKGAVYEHEKWAMDQADAVIAVSDYTKNVITQHYGISEDKIRVVRNASVEDEQRSISSIKSCVSEGPLVAFAGRLVGQKYPEAALEVMIGALDKVKNARGVLAGGGEKLHAIRDLVKFKGMGERIEVLGNVPQENMYSIYKEASVLIMPSVSEPFGLVALEAASAGAAVMLSDRCGVSEILKSAKVNKLYDTEAWIDGLVDLLENSELREAQVKQQFLEIENYHWSDASDAVLSIVGELLEKNEK